MHREADVRAIQRRQLGLVTAAQCVELGVTRKVVAGRVRAGGWERVLPEVYRDSGHPSSEPQLALAAVLWGGPAALVSHAAAGSLVALDGVEVDRPHIWVPPTRTARSELVVVHRGEVAAIDRRMIGPIPVTSPARTLIDLAGLLDDEDLAAALEDAIHRGLTTPMSISRRLDALGGKGRPGAARLRAILDDRGPSAAAASRLETMTLADAAVGGDAAGSSARRARRRPYLPDRLRVPAVAPRGRRDGRPVPPQCAPAPTRPRPARGSGLGLVADHPRDLARHHDRAAADGRASDAGPRRGCVSVSPWGRRGRSGRRCGRRSRRASAR